MLYLNSINQDDIKRLANLTLTNVVFEFVIKNRAKSDKKYLTLTSVVFEFINFYIVKIYNYYIIIFSQKS